ncbi:MAG: hypothetical protein HRT67_06975 [Flavobacteriaceae bacterium]|nr:hypothetical protein [Flavobacteriaceae bacterium]
MKYKLFIATTFLIFPILAIAQKPPDFCNQVNALHQIIDRNHYNPKALNDSLSKHVHQLFIETLDPRKTLFTIADVKQFEVNQFHIDDYIKTKNCLFIEEYISVFETRLNECITYISSLTDQNLDYTGSSQVRFIGNEEQQYFQNVSEINDYWNKRIRFKTIQKILEKDSIYSSIEQNFKTLESISKREVIAKEVCRLEEIKNKTGGISQHVKTYFLNAIANYYDPHTMFFSSAEKTSYESSLAISNNSFGIHTTKQSDGEIIISYIVTGSPAHKHNKLSTNDIILSLQSKDETLETICISNHDVQNFLNAPQNTTITLKVKKQNGGIETVELNKAIVKVASNNVTGFVLERNEEKLGYIRISSFYTDITNHQIMGVSNDVAKELYKLQKEHINGLIIDLRNNGGGSMKEANSLSGMFIDRGPISILKYRDGTSFTVRDMNRGMAFSKPLLILVNHFSASASEYFASTMQDYNRAIIAGNTTHGKSSAQIILPLEPNSNLGFCKVTTDKFYRVTGQSIQSKGVLPDIVFPSIYDNAKYEEAEKKFALANDSITIKLPARTLTPFDLKTLQTNSENRLKSNLYFETIKSLNHVLLSEYLFSQKSYKLTPKNIYDDITKSQNTWKQLSNKLIKAQLTIETKNSASTKEILSYNSEDAEINQTILKDIANDIYIEEAYNILTDYININK